MTLVARNDGVFDVTIYALPSGGSEPRIRVGMVTGSSTMTFVVPRHGLQASGALVLMLHAVGARGSWVSPSVVVPAGGKAHLDILSSPSGDLSRSAFYALTGTASAETGRRLGASSGGPGRGGNAGEPGYATQGVIAPR